MSYNLFMRLAAQGAQMIALSEDPLRPREQQLLQLARDVTSNPYLYLERWDASRPEEFTKAWREKGSKRMGVLGENIGNNIIDTVIRLPCTAAEAKATSELCRSLTQKSNSQSPNVTTSTQDWDAQKTVYTRIITVAPSPFYAAASSFPESNHSAETWHIKAKLTLDLARETLLAQKAASNSDGTSQLQLVYLTLAPCLSRTSLYDFCYPSPSQNPLSRLLNWILFLALVPLLWFFGQSEKRTAQAIEWAVLAPMQMSKSNEISLVRGVEPGKFYRDGKLVELTAI